MDQYRVIATRKGAAVVHRIGYLWADRYLEDLAVCRRPNTVRAYAFDLARWLNHCVEHRLEPLQLSPRDVLHFIEAERSDDRKVNERTISRRLSAIRQWYGYLALQPEQTGVTRNPITATGVLGTALGARRKQPSPLRYDRPLPQVLSSEEITHFLEHLTVSTYRDRAIVYLMWHAGLRISEALALQLGDIDWGSRLIVVRAGKSRRARRIPISQDTESLLGNYIRLERPAALGHERVFVCLGRRNHGQPLTYRAWVYICETTRQAAHLPRIHAHAFRHTCATNLAEGGMPLDSVQRQLGHARLETTMLYNDIRSRRLAKDYQHVMEESNAYK